MRFFTPQRYLQLGNLKNEKAFLAAQNEWEHAVGQYQVHLDKIRARLPAGLRRLIDAVYLHDAVVLDMWQDRRNRLAITLQPETDQARLVVLTYSLAKPPQFRRGVLPAERCSEPVTWLYDELDARGNRSQPRFQQRILLSNGWEISLQFHDVKVARPQAIIPLTRSA